MQKTVSARRSFRIRARHNGLGAGVGVRPAGQGAKTAFDCKRSASFYSPYVSYNS
jgi:hypothetical protein